MTKRDPDKSSGKMGPGGFCICPKCGYEKAHEMGIPCREEKCPDCGRKMVRKGSYHDELIKKKRTENKEAKI